jgi:hypothetical protein
MLRKILLGIAFIFVIAFGIQCGAQAGRQATFDQLLGSYVLDLHKTKLGKEYAADSDTYKTLTLTFFADSTFKMNKQVPFMYDSAGKWKAGSVNEWCWMLFDGFKYDPHEEHPGSQFTQPYNEGVDTFFLINAATPRDNKETISTIYFKKIHRQSNSN